MKRMLFISLLLITLIPNVVYSLEGKVVSVADGDTITILTSGKQQVKIRLYGIDCPEGDQAYGSAAKRFTAKLVAGKQVRVAVKDTDRYGRTVGVVTSGYTNVNEELIRNGYAWQYRKYCRASFCSDWLWYEDNARQEARGLWKGDKPISPWEWRKGAKNSSKKKQVKIKGKYHGNVKSHVFHAPGCRHYNCKNCTRPFSSISAAKKAGYRPHKQCVK